MMGKKAKIFMAIAIIATIAFFAFSGVRIVKSVQFDTNCKQYIKRAADANTVETAKEELAKAISYAEENGLTEGIVSIFLHQPKNDVSYWYNNMKEAYAELENLPEDASALERTNVLMKLRETLTDDKEDGVTVTVPEGIDVYPNNKAYFYWGWISFLLAVAFWILVAVADEYCWD